MNNNCPRCGETVYHTISSEKVYGEAWGTPYCEVEKTIEELECSCGFIFQENEDEFDVGIFELLDDGLRLDKDGYLKTRNLTEDTFNFLPGWHYATIRELEEWTNPSDEVKYFIKGERPDDFKPFELWDGRMIK